jgi:hypothetical protein
MHVSGAAQSGISKQGAWGPVDIKTASWRWLTLVVSFFLSSVSFYSLR